MGALKLEIHGPGEGSLVDVRSRSHMEHDGRNAPWPALVGWANRDWDRDGEECWEAMYAGPYRAGATRFETFGDPAEAVRWIATQLGEGH